MTNSSNSAGILRNNSGDILRFASGVAGSDIGALGTLFVIDRDFVASSCQRR